MPELHIPYRIESDSLGEVQVPFDRYYGAQTQRAIDNFQISSRKPVWAYCQAVVWIKYCAARVHQDLGSLSNTKAQAIIQACQEILDGQFNDQFVVDPYQAGAGTSHHMNVNEVIANRATEILGGSRGEYLIHPNDDVNMAQSTNDVIPTAIRLASLYLLPGMFESLQNLADGLHQKAKEFAAIRKSGRTHLQDAAPIHLGDEFGAYATAVERDLERIHKTMDGLSRLGIGGTAVGTGLNTHPEYSVRMVNALSDLSGFKLNLADNLFESMQSMADFADLSASLRTLAITLTKIANDLRLLSSGPTTGLDEIRLPSVQPGSSIMPGKVNPVMAEMLNLVMYQVMGCDTTVMLAAQAGQLELNVMMPVIATNLFDMIELITNSVKAFDEKCVRGITANTTKLQHWVDYNPIIITALNPLIGYKKGAELVSEALEKDIPIREYLLARIKKGELLDNETGKPITEADYYALIETQFH